MIQHAIAVMFGITALTPLKAAWIAITVANVVMMLRLGWRMPQFYFWVVAGCTLLQGGPWWRMEGEALLAGGSCGLVISMLPKHAYGRIFALSIGLVVTCVLMLAVPPPWVGYPADLYYTRLFSTAAFLGVAFGSALMTRNPSTMLAIPWFGAVLLASSQRGLDRWTVGIAANLTWTACLICWLALAGRAGDREASSTPDGLSDHPPTSQPVP